MGMFDDLIPSQGAPAASPRAGMFDDLIPSQPAASTTADVAGGIQGGIIRGAAGVFGLPGMVVEGGHWLADQINRQTVGRAINIAQGRGNVPSDRSAEAAAELRGVRVAPLPHDTIAAAESVIGPTYRPQTTPGKYAASVGEMVGSGAGVVPGIVGGLASEAAGQATAGTALEPWARAGAAIVGGGGAAIATRPGSAGQAVQRYAEGLTPVQVDAAEALVRDATAIGVPLTRAEAVQQVTGGGSRLGDLQRLVEGRGEMRPFMAERPGQVEAAGRQVFDTIAPVPAQPSSIGPQVGRAAEQEVGAAQAGINAATRPLYQASERVQVGPQVNAAITADPLYAQALQEVRNNPALNRTVAHLPDDSVGVLDLVQRRLRERADGSRVPGHADSGNLIAANLEDARTAPIAAAETATGSRAATPTAPAAAGTYEQARQAQETLRRQVLEPLMAGPIGKLADRDLTTGRAVEALFPKNPVPNSAQEVMDAVTALSTRNPWAAQQLVRAHAESVFNQATRDLQGGPNQWGGANFAAALRGNPQSAANLAAAVHGLPNGANILPGFDRFLDIMAATGQRQRAGSLTAYNAEALNELKQGGNIGTAVALAGGAATQWPKKLLEKFQQWNLGQNTEEIARILTAPEAAPLFRHLATSEAGPRQQALLYRLISMGGTGATAAERSRQ